MVEQVCERCKESLNATLNYLWDFCHRCGNEKFLLIPESEDEGKNRPCLGRRWKRQQKSEVMEAGTRSGGESMPVVLVKDKKRFDLLKVMCRHAKPDFTKVSKETGIALSTVYDNWIKMSKDNYIVFEARVNGALLTELEKAEASISRT
jgi:hypothetical protein